MKFFLYFVPYIDEDIQSCPLRFAAWTNPNIRLPHPEEFNEVILNTLRTGEHKNTQSLVLYNAAILNGVFTIEGFCMIDDIPVDENGSPLLSPLECSFFDIARQLEELYITYRGRYVMMTPNGKVFIPRYKDPKTGELKDHKITNKVVCGHLNGRYAICVYAGSAASKFVCFDVDDGNPDTVRTIIRILTEIGFPKERIYVSTSGGKGFHVEMFFTSLMFTCDLKNIYNYVCAIGKLNTSKVEFRPTRAQSIKLPLSIHGKTGNICWYLDQETLKPITNPEYIMEIQKIPHELAFGISHKLPRYGYIHGFEQEKVAPKVLTKKDLSAFDLNCYPDLTCQGKRHDLMVHIAVYNKYLNMSREQNEDELRKWYRRQNPDFINSTESQIEYEIVQILDWVYGDKFVIGSQHKDIVFVREDVRIILSQKKRSERSIVFLVQYYSKLYGSCCMSANYIAKKTRLGERTARSTLQCLIENEWVDRITSPSHIRNQDGTYKSTPSRYRISGKSYTRELVSIQMKTDEIKLRPDMDLDKAYHEVLTAFVSDKDLRKCLTKKEYKEIMNDG